ncbi:Sterol-sensing domain and Patched family-containing protein [Strongyloides ratti]|uniref:Sterol-sensing domain and Patched family-containing protein n=1 Tax=Strongyloides ratti TaxID=34506 RepID=A0A090KTR8_STRRB|nr:Sterol-sensing domain and Patched family-containing protein [Strongyloides ratti]CEF60801.1 Sterol-sensing domain and Patched family-containing protein [Strongyloides ratti]
MSLFYKHLSIFVAKNPFIVIFVTLITILPICSYYIFLPFTFKTDIRRGFAHRNGEAKYEFKVLGDFYNLSVDNIEIVALIIKGKNQTRLPITFKVLSEIERLDHFIQNNTFTYNNETIKLKDIYSPRGTFNFLFDAFKMGYEMQKLNYDVSLTLSNNINLSYPNSYIFGHKVFLGSHFFGVNLYNDSLNSHISSIKDVDMCSLWYMLHPNTKNQYKMMINIEKNLFEYFKLDNFSNILNVQIYGDEIANLEMLRGSINTTKMLIFGITGMIIYMFYVFRDIPYLSQIILLIGALSSPGLASLISFSFIGWFGISINSMMSITPFLVLGIGVDDAFLIYHCWQKHSMIKNNIKRFSTVIQEAGPSMTITSITNTLAFSIGITSPSSQMSEFCICTAVAVFADFILEFTIFAPLFLILNTNKKNNNNKENNQNEIFIKKEKYYWSSYTNFVISIQGKIIVIFILIIMYILAGIGMNGMESTFQPRKTFPQDSELINVFENLDEIYSEYAPVTLMVHSPPNITNKESSRKFMEMIEKLEEFPESWSKERSYVWLRDYEEYFNKNIKNSSKILSYELVPKFLNENYMNDKSVVKYTIDNNGNVKLNAFVIVIINHQKRSWHERAYLLSRVRNLINKYPEYNVTAYDYDATIFDLIITVPEEMLKAVLLTIGCMSIVCFFVVPDIIITSVAIISVTSIALTLIGILGLLGQDLDIVIMVNILMAIGFAVDYAAHISFHYYKLKVKLRNDIKYSKISNEHQLIILSKAFSYVGMPMIEAALSTIICMFPLFLIHVPIVKTFAQTVCLVSIIGTIHGLLITPSLLTINFFQNYDKNKQNYMTVSSHLKLLTTEDEKSNNININEKTVNTDIKNNKETLQNVIS